MGGSKENIGWRMGVCGAARVGEGEGDRERVMGGNARDDEAGIGEGDGGTDIELKL